MTEPQMLTQTAPYPSILADLVSRARFEPRWRAYLTEPDFQRDEDHGRGESRGLTLVFTAVVPDTYHPETLIAINHFFAVPPSTYNEASWQRWLFDRYCDVRLHEAMEFFQVAQPCDCGFPGEGWPGGHKQTCPASGPTVRPYSPNHGPGEHVYTVREMTTDEARRTQYTGGLDHNRARPGD